MLWIAVSEGHNDRVMRASVSVRERVRFDYWTWPNEGARERRQKGTKDGEDKDGGGDGARVSAVIHQQREGQKHHVEGRD